ncbi:MAG: Type 1 glutamine amidotransferase-like domain-containing protein [Candidatus Zixiibacteriota bacterium]
MNDSVQACVDLVGKPQDQITVAIINEAFAVEKGDKRWVLQNLHSVFDNFSSEVDIVDLLALSIKQIEERLANKDVIFVLGGDTDYLMSVYEKSGFDKLLPELLKNKVYVGSSAGSMVIGKRIPTNAYEIIYGHQVEYGVDRYLELVDFSIIPHLDSPEFPERKEKFKQAIDKFDAKVYGLSDDSAVVVNGHMVRTIGSEPLILN